MSSLKALGGGRGQPAQPATISSSTCASRMMSLCFRLLRNRLCSMITASSQSGLLLEIVYMLTKCECNRGGRRVGTSKMPRGEATGCGLMTGLTIQRSCESALSTVWTAGLVPVLQIGHLLEFEPMRLSSRYPVLQGRFLLLLEA